MCLLQDWKDIDFAIAHDVDFIAISFVKSADVINNLKSYVSSRAEKTIEIISKVESFDSVPNIQEIVEASDGVMVARGDLGDSCFPPGMLCLACKPFSEGQSISAPASWLKRSTHTRLGRAKSVLVPMSYARQIVLLALR